ncbi:MAG: Sec-independent protein translocase protein TatB [Gammaproteobacteria bacterium]|nr:Sec-independent protein translocase protein TatB [Gammaproteobacteria bacterium]
MFDIGFWELAILFALALVVLGPKKLPELAATLGRWIGRARFMARSLKAQIDTELAIERANEAQKKKDQGAESTDRDTD